MIVVRYQSVDRFSKQAKFQTLEAAQAFAQHWVGETPELGYSYAVSADGVGTVKVQGCLVAELFPKLGVAR